MDPAADLAAQLGRLPDRAAYVRAASELLVKLFPSEEIGWNALDARAERAEVLLYPDDPFADVGQTFLEVCADHPLVLSYLNDTGDGIWLPRRLSDVVSDRELYQTHAYQLGLAVLGTNRQLSFLSSQSGTAFRGWAMNRWGHDFSEGELDLARHVQPILRLLDLAYADGNSALSDEDASENYSLTAREQEVMKLVSQGFTAVAMGHLLGISPRTISKHVEHAYAKLSCNNRVDAVRRFSGR